MISETIAGLLFALLPCVIALLGFFRSKQKILSADFSGLLYSIAVATWHLRRENAEAPAMFVLAIGVALLFAPRMFSRGSTMASFRSPQFEQRSVLVGIGAIGCFLFSLAELIKIAPNHRPTIEILVGFINIGLGCVVLFRLYRQKQIYEDGPRQGGSLHGPGERYWPDGTIERGHFNQGVLRDGRRENPTIGYMSGTFDETGHFADGEIDIFGPHGVSERGIYRSGNLVSGSMSQDNLVTKTGIFWPTGGLRAGRVTYLNGDIYEGWFTPSGEIFKGKIILERSRTVLQGAFKTGATNTLVKEYLYSLDDDEEYAAEYNRTTTRQVISTGVDWDSLKAILLKIFKLEPSFQSEISGFVATMNRLKTTKTSRMAVIGESSAGKSTFINTLIGEQISKTAHEECTAIPILISYTHNRRYFGLLADSSEKELSKEAFEELQINGCKEFRYLKATGPFEILRKLDIELIDTPGVASKVEGREDITIAAIREADGCFLLMDSKQDGSQSFLTFADKARDIQSRVFFLVSRADGRHEEEIDEIIDIAIPRLAKRFNVPNSRFMLIGTKKKKNVKTPLEAITVITEFLSNERSSIEREKVEAFQNAIETSLTPRLNALEGKVIAKLSQLRDQPDSFRQIWRDWRRELYEAHRDGSVIGQLEKNLAPLKLKHRSLGNTKINKIVDGILFIVDEGDVKKVQRVVNYEFSQFKGEVASVVRDFIPKIGIEGSAGASKVFTLLEGKGIRQKSVNDGHYCGDLAGPEDIKRFLNFGLLSFLENTVLDGIQDKGRYVTDVPAGAASGARFAYNSGGLGLAAALTLGLMVLDGQQKKNTLRSEGTAMLNNALDELYNQALGSVAHVPHLTEWLFEKASRILESKYSELFRNDFSEVRSERHRLNELRTMLDSAHTICQSIQDNQIPLDSTLRIA